MAISNGNSANPFANGGAWSSVPLPSHVVHEGESILPEDAEVQDYQELKEMIDREFDRKYPRFEPRVIYTPNKDYFLPALKVLSVIDGKIYSPSRVAEWENMELKAACFSNYMYRHGDPYIPHHESPDPGCNCGIYGGVNIDEINEFIQNEINRRATPKMITPDKYGHFSISISMTYPDDNKDTHIICLIEPSPGAEVIVCRKGWKASHAFISEVLGETMKFDDAESLLSIAWNRQIDLRRLIR